ncbi:MAG: 16S rRNA (cytidine(1402)-2'-O)-methyltransferase [Muribaculaceae bacterium]|nr:16S rRNA (cytidine(1402)-2'-O)-methyltransferase [Muribaculaceae bacterium]
MASTLYIVPTPVGNLADMTPRAVEVLRSASLILAEDTRTSGVLMRHFGITTPMASHHKFNEHRDLSPILDRIEAGEDIALVSDAGTPGISDPGFMLSRECRRRGLRVETLPGATAFVPALVNSGLPCDRFFFEGFLPPKKGRATRLEFLASLPVTFIIYESPLRLARTLENLAEACGADRPAAVCREISKMHDTTERGTLGELQSYYGVNQARGEIVIIVGGRERPAADSRRHKNKYRSDTPDDDGDSDD